MSIGGILLLIGLAELLPLEGIQPGIAVGLIFGIRGFIRYSHAPAIKNYVSSGGQTYPIVRSIAVGITSLIATLALMAPFIL